MQFQNYQQIHIDRQSAQPVYLQICQHLTACIQAGTLPASVRLAPSRKLAASLGLHRKTVVSAYEELVLQGWLESRPRRGYFVASKPPLTDAVPLATASQTGTGYPDNPCFSVHYAINPTLVRAQPMPSTRFAFDDGFPDTRLAPIAELAKQYQTIARRKISGKLLSYSAKEGSFNLRQQLARMLRQTRGMNVQADNIMVTKGAQMGIFLTSSLLLRPGDHVIVSSPGYFVVNLMLERLGARLHHVPVDGQGIQVDIVEEICQRHPVRMIYIIPHHHHPTTATLIAERRIALLELAERFGAAIIEDDFDFDIHFQDMPLMPMASIDRNGSVVYVGTLSKVLAPAIRIGYIVAPKHLISLLSQHRYLIDLQGDTVLEEAVAELLKNGVIERHLKKMRSCYRERRDLLCNMLAEDLSAIVEFTVPAGGMCLWVKLNGVPVKRVCENAGRIGLILHDGSRHFQQEVGHNVLCLGFASMDCQELRAATELLVHAIRVSLPKGSTDI